MPRRRIRLAKRIAYDTLGIVVFAFAVSTLVIFVAAPIYNGARIAARAVTKLFD